eukprot:gb/GECG01001577.1/.p1 GENE.gb/GECG01001577.1/~~gb/GECG01001577.1/.p1  ORF type:complete len:865 (+),score=143.79 gb/GECG01001577.1/:1-2595(+)
MMKRRNIRNKKKKKQQRVGIGLESDEEEEEEQKDHIQQPHQGATSSTVPSGNGRDAGDNELGVEQSQPPPFAPEQRREEAATPSLADVVKNTTKQKRKQSEGQSSAVGMKRKKGVSPKPLGASLSFAATEGVEDEDDEFVSTPFSDSTKSKRKKKKLGKDGWLKPGAVKTAPEDVATRTLSDSNVKAKSAYYGDSGPSYSAEELESLKASQKTVRNTTQHSKNGQQETAQQLNTASQGLKEAGKETPGDTINGSVSQNSSTTAQIETPGRHYDEPQEDIAAWEEEQIRRGRGISSNSNKSLDKTKYENSDSTGSNSLHRIISRLKQFSLRSKENVSQFRRELNQMKSQKDDVQKKLEGSRLKVESQRKLYDATQDFLNYVKNLCELINEKEPMISDLERGLEASERGVKTEYASHLHAVAAALCRDKRLMGSWGEEFNTSSDGNVQTTQHSVVGGTWSENDFDADRVDVFRMNLQESSFLSDFCGLFSEERIMESVHSFFLSTSSIEQFPGVNEVRNAKLSKLIQARDMILQDVTEKYSKSTEILNAFDGWRRDFQQHYCSMYTSLSLPSLLAPFARIDMAVWIPFASNEQVPEEIPTNTDIEAFPWVSAVQRFCEQDSAIDEDKAIMEKVFALAAIPRIESLIQHSYNPHSTQETEVVKGILQQAMRLAPQDETKRRLCDALRDLLEKSAEERSAPIIINEGGEISNGSIYCVVGLLRLLYNSVKVLDVIHSETLEETVIERILGDVCLPAIQTIGEITVSYKVSSGSSGNDAVSVANVVKYCQLVSLLVCSIPETWIDKALDQSSSISAILDVLQDSIQDVLTKQNKNLSGSQYLKPCFLLLRRWDKILRPQLKACLQEVFT